MDANPMAVSDKRNIVRAVGSISIITAAVLFLTLLVGDLDPKNDIQSSPVKFIRRLTSESEQENGITGTELEHAEGDHEEIEIPHVVLFPWFAQLIGIAAYWIISRCAHGIPYTAFMFISGGLLGFFARRAFGNAIIESTQLWLGINGEIIILTFLPGLLFLDSYKINVYLFMQSFWQLVMFAFPMVLGGTFLTATAAYYIFPYGWSFDLCMTFGSILAATDPVAVSVLLNELGAPSRLKIHIAGESLLNDGSAVVFYHIFSSRFFYELGVEGFGEEVGWGRGIALFFRLSLGGALIGLAFGIGLVTLLFNFNRRLSLEENVLQVTCTITVAYLAFYVSEILAGCSGIIAVLFCGLTTKAFGETMLNDSHLTHDFWHIMEHLLNTTLFALGGAVWGGVISHSSELDGGNILPFFSGTDWIYLVMLFVMVMLVRFLLVFLFFPITRLMGIGQDWREAVFMSYGGLRGAVGISLALLLSAEVFKYSALVSEEKRDQYREFAYKLFGFAGGISFLTLVVNGPTAKYLLKSLGLVTPTEARKQVVENYERHMRQNALEEYIHLLSENCFADIDYGIVAAHVSPLKNITPVDIDTAVAKFKKKHADKTPNLSNLYRYVSPPRDESGVATFPRLVQSRWQRIRNEIDARKSHGDDRGTIYDFRVALDRSMLLEERLIFIDLVRQEYHRQLEAGDLDSRGFIPFSLLQSLEFAENAASKGFSLNDWESSQAIGDVFTSKLDRLLHSYRVGGFWNRKEGDRDFNAIRTQVLQALSFIKAHLAAMETFKGEFTSVDGQTLTLAEKKVIDESRDQVSKADAVITSFDEEDVTVIKSQYVCQILLNKSAKYIERLSHHGLMTEREACQFLDKFDQELRALRVSSERKSEFRNPNRIAPEI